MKLSISADFIDHCRTQANIPPEDIKRIISEASRDVGKFSDILVQEGWFNSHELGKYIADSVNCSFVDMNQTVFQPEALEKIPKEVAKQLCVIPLYNMGLGITVAMANPFDTKAISELKKHCDGLIVSPVFSLQRDIKIAIDKHYS